jgi:hypothetical protein
MRFRGAYSVRREAIRALHDLARQYGWDGEGECGDAEVDTICAPMAELIGYLEFGEDEMVIWMHQAIIERLLVGTEV